MHVCTRSFSTVYDGEHITINAGECVASDHELVARAPEAFEPEEIAVRRAAVALAAADPAAREAGATFHTPRSTSERVAHDHVRDEARRANDRADFLPDLSRAYMDRQLREDSDPDALMARYVAITSDRAYFRAFSAWMNDPVSGGHSWTDEERDAVRRVQWLQRSMTLGTGGAGGFLVPYELDPNVVISSAGYVDPMRAVARVETTAYNEKRFVTSTGVTSHWYAEEAEVTDDGPALLQPTVTCRKAMAFVPVSFELFEDSSIAQQISTLFMDSKAAEEARVFTTGNGTTEPKGIITALVAAGGSTVIATASNVLATADVYTNQNALPARWRPQAKWMMNLSTINGFRQLIKGTGLTESLVDDSGPRPRMAGWEIMENSNMDSTLTGAAADYALLSGDYNQFAICDRLTTTIEIVPHLMGASRRPTAQRGFLLRWRVGSDVLVPSAFSLTNYST